MDELKVVQAEDKISRYRHKIMDGEWSKVTQCTTRLNDPKDCPGRIWWKC